MRVITTTDFNIKEQAKRCVHEFRSGALAVRCNEIQGIHTIHAGWQDDSLVTWNSGEYYCEACGQTNLDHAPNCRIKNYLEKWTRVMT